MQQETKEPKSKMARARKKAGLTQTQAAERIRVDFSTISKWETGAQNYTFDRLVAMAEAYGCAVSDLLEPEHLSKDHRTYVVPIMELRDIENTRIGAYRELALNWGGREMITAVQSETCLGVNVSTTEISRRIVPGMVALVDYRDKDLVDNNVYLIRVGRQAMFRIFRERPIQRWEPESHENGHETIFETDKVEVVGRVVGAHAHM